MKIHIITKIFIAKCLIITFFAGMYYYARNDFINISLTNKPVNFYDCLNLSTTIQSTIGISDMHPKGNTGYIIMILHQIVSIPSLLIATYLIHTF